MPQSDLTKIEVFTDKAKRPFIQLSKTPGMKFTKVEKSRINVVYQMEWDFSKVVSPREFTSAILLRFLNCIAWISNRCKTVTKNSFLNGLAGESSRYRLKTFHTLSPGAKEVDVKKSKLLLFVCPFFSVHDLGHVCFCCHLSLSLVWDLFVIDFCGLLFVWYFTVLTE